MASRNMNIDSELDELDKHLLNDFQYGFPLESRPFRKIAARLGTTEDAVIDRYTLLQEQGVVSRVGAVFRANSVGASTLAALSVPDDQLEEVAALVSSYREVNHNYQRDHHYNLWFVVTACDEQALNAVLDEIEQGSGLDVLYLPMQEDFHIDLGFDLKWT